MSVNAKRVLGLLAALALGAGCSDTFEETFEGRADLSRVTYSTQIVNGISPTISFTVPDDALSVLIEVKGGSGKYFLAKFQDPDQRDVLGAAVFPTLFARSRPGIVNWLYPNRPDEELIPGTYKMIVRGENASGGPLNESVDISFLYKTDTGPCAIAVDFLYDAEAIHPDDVEEALDLTAARMNVLYQQADVRLLNYSMAPVVLPTPDVDLADHRNVLAYSESALSQGRSVGSVRPEAIHVIVVRNLGGSKEEAHGYSLGLPGPFEPDRATSAVFIATEGYARGGVLDIPGLATTLTHEVGHFLGLYHTTESDGVTSDPIPDTPDPDVSGTNIMTSVGAGEEAGRTMFTRGQAEVIRRHPLCRPERTLP